MLDTHVLVRWLTEVRRLSRDQARMLRQAVARGDLLGVSASSLTEIAVLFGTGNRRSHVSAEELFASFELGAGFHIVPIDLEVAREVAALGDSLRDPADRVIVATARVHGLRLVTSDQRIIASKLVSVVE